MKRIVILWLGLVLGGGAFSQSNAGAGLLHITPVNPSNSRSALVREANKPASATPHFACISGSNDLGYLRLGASQEFELVIANQGARHLQIKNVTSATGQVAVVSHDTYLAPFATGKLFVKIKPSRTGNFLYHLTVISNADNFVEVITLKGVAY